MRTIEITHTYGVAPRLVIHFIEWRDGAKKQQSQRDLQINDDISLMTLRWMKNGIYDKGAITHPANLLLDH